MSLEHDPMLEKHLKPKKKKKKEEKLLSAWRDKMMHSAANKGWNPFIHQWNHRDNPAIWTPELED